jgi:Chaperone of endosialidase
VGRNALVSNITGNGNTALGISAGSDVTDASNVICIGHVGANVNDSCFIGNIRDALVAPDASPVLIDSAGKLGTTSGSSRRFKNEIQPMEKASESIMALRPVTFHYKTDKTNTTQFGLIAEEVAQVNPELVVRDQNGELLTVRYEAVNAMLLNEFLKEHRKNEQQEETITQLKSSAAREQAIAARQQEEIKALAGRSKSRPRKFRE